MFYPSNSLRTLLLPTDLVFLRMRDRTLLGLDFFDTTLQILTRTVFAHVHTRHEHRCVGEEIIHFLEGTLSSLRKEAVEEDRVG